MKSEQLVMVGDSVANDVSVAQAAGWRAVRLNRDGSGLPAGAGPDAVVSTLAQVPDLVRRGF